MQSNATLRRHARLVDQMADALGVDLEEAVLRARIEPDEIADAVLRCTGCTNPDGCETALAGGEVTDTAPGFCRNAGMFAALTVPR